MEPLLSEKAAKVLVIEFIDSPRPKLFLAQRDARKNHVSLNPTALQNILPNSTRPERLIIASDPWGGIPAKNRKGERLNLYLGIIDILQCYKSK